MLGHDLRALRNLLRSREGRQVVAGQAIVFGCIALGSLALGSSFLMTERIKDIVEHDWSGFSIRLLFTILVALPPLLVLGVGMPQLNSGLYRAAQVPLLLTAPITSFSVLLRTYARSLAGWLAFSLALGGPAMGGVVDHLELPWYVWLGLPIGMLSLLAPIVALQVLMKVAAVRWLSGPRVRIVFAALHFTLCFALVMAVMFGFASGREISGAIADWLSGAAALPWWFEASAALPAALAGVSESAARLLMPVWSIALAAVPLLLAAALYRRSYEAFCTAEAPLVRIAGGSRSWPVTPVRSILAKARAETLRTKSTLLFYAFLVVALVVLIAQGFEPRQGEELFPREMQEGFYVFSAWHGLSLLVASLAFLGLVGDEQQQIALLATAPVDRGAILRGKILVIAVPFFVMIVSAILTAPVTAGVGSSAGFGLLLFGPALVLAYLGVIVAIGTWPAFVRLHDDVPLASSMRAVVPILVIVAACTATFFVRVKVRGALVSRYYGHGVFADYEPAKVMGVLLAACWGIGLVVFAVGYAIGRRNLERILGPQLD